MNSSINENIQTVSAAARLVVYTNQSETYPTELGYAILIPFNHVQPSQQSRPKDLFQV